MERANSLVTCRREATRRNRAGLWTGDGS
jgi:hypothetical protein